MRGSGNATSRGMADVEKLKALCQKQQSALKVLKEKLAAAEAGKGGGGGSHSDEDYDKLKKMVTPQYKHRTHVPRP